MVQIDKDIPIPKARLGAPKWPVAKMSVGDSFLITEKQRTYMAKLFKQHGMRCATRAEGAGVRVWRIE